MNVHPSKRTKTALIVDDEHELTELITLLLVQEGFKVFASLTERAALEIWARHKKEIELALLDIHLARRLGGFGLAQQMKAEKPDLKVILSSGHSPVVFGDTSLVEGVNFLQKPFTPAELRQIVSCQFPK
jgi:DNA-binding NtrC family response regulator